ncbi:MAG TPA: methyltransferase domain-containing protein [Kiritimatiellia bacterium]|nr:methyltransferase domain-containing protein [Kiritimatiellia bacterium]
MDLVHPATVLDIGCGTCDWLNAFQAHGSSVTGVDGPYADIIAVKMDPSRVILHNLETPLDLQTTFDLVVSLEVAEHIHPLSAKTFIDSVTRHGKIILFSAAIPLQGGQNHLNEQWPGFWRRLFKENGYYYCDIIRPKFWDDQRVDVFYRQNMFLVCENSLRDRYPETNTILNIVHPESYLRARRKPFHGKRIYEA